MAYLGINPATPLLNTSTETFSGNSAATQFTLNRSIASASDIDVMIGSTLQRPFTDYTAGNTQLLFTSAPTTGSNNITVTYRAGALNTLDLTASVFETGTEGNPSVYSLAGDNTGIYWANSQSMSITVQGSDRAVFLGNATSVNSTTGALVVSGGIGATGNLNVDGIIATTNATQSTSVYTGALQLAGGAGIAGNLNVGGDITCVGDFTVNGTFTTTGTDSLEVNDPFIFLANANPGDTYDSGVITQYFDGTNTRYSGYFRDITDNKYKLFGNLLPKPGTTVDTANASFQYQDLVLANVSATGNVNAAYFVGNGAGLTGISSDSTQILNGNSKVVIPALNGNILSNVNGATVGVTASTGFYVTGIVSATGNIAATANISGGNISVSGLASATGNITSAGNVSGGNILTGGAISAAANVTGGNLTTAGQTSAGGNITGGNIRTAGIVSAAGTVYTDSVSATNGVSAGTTVSATTDITAGATISAAGDIITSANVSGVSFNGTNLSLTGNVLSAINSTANITTTGNIAGGNIVSTALLQGGTLSASGGVTFSTAAQAINIATSQTTGNANIGGTTQTGFITVGRSTATQPIYIGNGVTSSGNTKTLSIGENGAAGSTTNINIGPALGTGAIAIGAAATVAIANTSSTALSVAGNITGGNLVTSGSGGNITGANVVSATTFNGTTVSMTGNVTGGNIITAGAFSAVSVSASGNVTGGNIITNGAMSAGGLISATGNVTGGNINTAGLVSSTGNVTNGIANVLTGNAIVTTLAQAATLSATGNVIAGNLNAAGLSLSGNVLSGISSISTITTTANITGGNVLFGAGIVSGTGNVNGGNVISAALVQGVTVSASGNVIGGNLNAAGLSLSSNVVSALNSTANITTTANISGGNIAGTLTTASQTNITSVGTLGSLTVTANVTGGNILTGGLISAAGAITSSGITVPSISHSGTTGVGDIGSSAQNFATVYATTFSGISTQAKYADLAENYAADAGYAPGTVLEFGGDNEVTLASSNSPRVAGVISTNPAHVMNSAIDAEHIATLALTGRVPTSVVGTVRKGDMMVSAGNGAAIASSAPTIGTVIGKALENFDGDTGVIEIVIGRL